MTVGRWLDYTFSDLFFSRLAEATSGYLDATPTITKAVM